MTQRRGSVLVGLLWCLTLLSVVVIGVLHLARLDLKVTQNYADTIQARYLALAGVEKAKALLYRDMMERQRAVKSHSGELHSLPEQFRDVRLGRGEFSVFRQGRRDEGGGILYGVSDEESRLNVNHASSQELSKILGMTEDVLAAIQDWRDGDNSARPSGAEAEHYASLRPPYLPRNGPFQTMRELLMVRGVTRELLSGEDANQNGLLDPEEDDGRASLPVDDADGVLDSGWSELLTIDSMARNENSAGQARVDIKSADERTLSSVRGISEELAKAIVAYRNQDEFETIADLLDVRAMVPQSPGAVEENSRRPPGGGPQSGARSGTPLPQQQSRQRSSEAQPNLQPTGPPLINEDLLIEIADDITTGSDTEQPGAININTASPEVLACLPGVSRELGQAIVAYRKSAGYFPNIAAVLKVDGMTRDIFKQLAPKICARSETFRILSEGRVPLTGARRRVEMVVRVSSGNVETLSYREDL
ncbi:MAG: type II secretion system protein GspK [Verrucomicrobia subdivision 3 bacterium]|nr:type II secretion system protein GspK [Limisphaerales bacterium]